MGLLRIWWLHHQRERAHLNQSFPNSLSGLMKDEVWKRGITLLTYNSAHKAISVAMSCCFESGLIVCSRERLYGSKRYYV